MNELAGSLARSTIITTIKASKRVDTFVANKHARTLSRGLESRKSSRKQIEANNLPNIRITDFFDEAAADLTLAAA